MSEPSHAIIDRALRNYAGGVWDGYRVMDLLRFRVSPGAGTARTRLLERLGDRSWEVVRGPHESPADATTHITLGAGQHRYHLRLDGNGVIFMITDGDGSLGMPPWVPPGAGT